MRIWRTEHTFEHSWETVAQAAARKYPNPMNSAIVSQDVVDRRLLPGGRLATHRLYGTNFSGIVQRLNDLGFGRVVRALSAEDAETYYGSEHTLVDARDRCYTLRARNITFASSFTMDETLVYQPHPEAPDSKTLLKQSVTITCHWWPIGRLVETVLEELVYSKMAPKGPEAIEWVIGNTELKTASLKRSSASSTSSLSAASSSSSSSSYSSTPSLSDVGSGVEALRGLVESGIHQVEREVKQLARLAVDEHFLIM